MLPPQQPSALAVIAVGDIWFSKGTGGHAKGSPAKIVGLSPYRVTIEPLQGHGKRKGRYRGFRRSPTREEFYATYAPRRPGA